ncbi:MAG: hypothetical protein L3J39_10335 [Verrucomicrobiales bacterium]|nr:hypothetical protein [Verrucomicrobiales bacterium]
MKTRARDNAFSSERVDELLPFEPEWLGQTWQGLMQRLVQLDYRAAVVGPHGSGKSTLLQGLKLRLQEDGVEVVSFFLNEDSRSLSEVDWQRLREAGGKVVFLDGAEQLDWLRRRRFYALASHCRGVVVTQHQASDLPLLIETQTSLKMLQDFVNRLDPTFAQRGICLDTLFQENGGNLREALWSCYDLVAS